ncbi:helicase domain protein [Nitzschia inconspicua]|uniref:Helicase domain protein n=1 Tax=Nitzschia inconspicua TaxID=303405 RepID=A0A9K3P950_9STRA|nr:helicase domain protein [Nitzschia inconspicua]KAG7362664.1 helicase domain protein [Nitzschia inconspicua]
MGHSNLNAFDTVLEPTPIRPDHEIVIRKLYCSMKNNHQEQKIHPNTSTTDHFGASAEPSFSNLFLRMDDETLNLHQANFGIMITGNFSKECSTEPEMKPFDVSVLFGENTSLPNTSDSSSASIRFHKNQKYQWDGQFQELLLFHQEHSHLLVRHSYPPNQKLAQWVKRQRHQYKRKQLGCHSTLTDEREKQLLEVGFIFESHHAAWQARFETLKDFSLANGHCRIPPKFRDGSLNLWIKHQRRQYVLLIRGEKSTMTDERITALNSIGFNWNPRNLVRPSNV